MSIGILGKKVGMTQIFKENGEKIPVTVINAGPCTIVQKKTEKTDGYCAVQLGFGEIKVNRVNKPRAGHFKKANTKPSRSLKEFCISSADGDKFNVGDEVTVNIFEKGAFVDVTSKTKGRGFTGVLKRHNFSRPTMTHGTHEAFRHGGSIGCQTPQRVVKGKKMPGHYGNTSVTIQNLEIVDIIEDKNLLLVRGAVPGHKDTLVKIRKALKKPSVKK